MRAIYTFCENILQIQLLKEALVFGVLAAILAILISPLQFLKIQKQETGQNYLTLLKARYKQYGVLVFFSGAIPYALLQFFSSASFGVSEFFSTVILNQLGMQVSFIAVLFRTLMAGVIETSSTIFFEMKEIEKNKINLLEADPKVKTIFFPLLLRNSFYWLGSLVSIYIIKVLEIKYSYCTCHTENILISFFIGVIFAVLTIPFDVVTTQNLGSSDNLSILQRLKKNVFEGGYVEIFRGSLMRILISTCFTICTVLTDKIIR